MAGVDKKPIEMMCSLSTAVEAAALTTGFQDAFLVGAFFALAGAILAAILISSKDSKEHAEAAQAEGAEVEPVVVG